VKGVEKLTQSIKGEVPSVGEEGVIPRRGRAMEFQEKQLGEGGKRIRGPRRANEAACSIGKENQEDPFSISSGV